MKKYYNIIQKNYNINIFILYCNIFLVLQIIYNIVYKYYEESKFLISHRTTQYERYVLVHQSIGTLTACYRVIPDF